MKERSGMPYDVVAFETDELTKFWSAEAEGYWHRLIRSSWINGSLPNDVAKLAVICRCKSLNKMEKIWKEIGESFTEIEKDPTRLINKKQESERQYKSGESQANSINGKKGAEKRWGKKPEVSTESTNRDGGGHELANSRANSEPMARPMANDNLPPLPSPSHPIPPLSPFPDSPNPEDLSARPKQNGRAVKTETPEDFRKAWAVIEKSIRRNIESETFEKLYAGIRPTAFTATHVVLAVQESLLMRYGDGAREHMEAIIRTADPEWMRDRKLELVSIKRFLEGAMK